MLFRSHSLLHLWIGSVPLRRGTGLESAVDKLRHQDFLGLGFAIPDALLTGVETRTSAPLRIVRDTESGVSPTQSLVYPCGEGAGYAGGITSAAVDGIRCALRIMKRFCPLDHE